MNPIFEISLEEIRECKQKQEFNRGTNKRFNFCNPNILLVSLNSNLFFFLDFQLSFTIIDKLLTASTTLSIFGNSDNKNPNKEQEHVIRTSSHRLLSLRFFASFLSRSRRSSSSINRSCSSSSSRAIRALHHHAHT
jgi:hypothetical protein